VPDPAIARAWHEQAKRRAVAPREAYAMAVAADQLRERQADVGYRLYWIGATILGSRDVVAQPSGYAVVGRHGSCDVVLDADADDRVVSLRHVLVRAASLDDGFPVISLLDLQTSAGFELSDGTKQRSVAATGPVVFRIATCSLVALPSSGHHAAELPVPVVQEGGLAPPRAAPVSRITLLPHSVDFSSRRSAPIDAPAASHEPYVPTGEGYEVILETHQRRVGVRLSNADLEHGVLIGRSDKCVDEGLRSILSDTVSRVHVLLIREKGTCRLYDCASLVGTYAHGQRVRCLALSDVGTAVQLAGRGGVTLHWRAL
jgi:hypothetical protein